MRGFGDPGHGFTPASLIQQTGFERGDDTALHPGQMVCNHASRAEQGRLCPRHLVVDADGNQFRYNGFRRIARISSRRGSWMVRHFAHIERMQYRFSVWHWYHAPWAELDLVEAVEVVPA
jgi:hypothetical protein